MDVSGNGLHGEVNGDVLLSKEPTPHVNSDTSHPREYSFVRFGLRYNTYLNVTDPEYDLSKVGLTTTSAYAYMMQFMPKASSSTYKKHAWVSYNTDFSNGVS